MFVVCLTSKQHASVSQGRSCSDKLTCCHTEIKVADPTFYLTKSQYTDTGPTSPSNDPITPGTCQGRPLECQFFFKSLVSLDPGKISLRKQDLNPGSSGLEADALTTRPPRRFFARTGGELGMAVADCDWFNVRFHFSGFRQLDHRAAVKCASSTRVMVSVGWFAGVAVGTIHARDCRGGGGGDHVTASQQLQVERSQLLFI